MKRLTWSIARDLLLMYRSGLHYVAVVSAFLWILALKRTGDAYLDRQLPDLLLANLFFTAWYLIFRMVRAEKMDGALVMLDLTPLRPHEYLASKAASIALLSLTQTFLIVFFTQGPAFNMPALALGAAMATGLFVLLAFLIVSRGLGGTPGARPTGRFAFPLLGTLVLLPALIHTFGFPDGPLMRFHPAMAPLTLIRAAFHSAPWWQWAYGSGFSLLSIMAALVACRRAFTRIRAGG